MSNPLHIALIAEGPTELSVIEAALQAILSPRRFILTLLQPEPTKPEMGAGWGGVLKWCSQLAGRQSPGHATTVESDLTLSLYDGVLLQLDADVATFKYSDLRPPYSDQEVIARGWHALPCGHTCPPTNLSSDALCAVLKSWLYPAVLGAKTVVCIPAMNIGAWMAAANLPTGHALLVDLECRIDIENSLRVLPKELKIDKKKRESRLAAARTVFSNWSTVTTLCSRAHAFEQAIRNAFP